MPPRPAGALTLTRARNSSAPSAETSTKPPSPPSLPPRAESAPCARAASSAHTTMRPPLPAVTASARKLASGPSHTRSVLAVDACSAPLASPMLIMPPAVVPEASIAVSPAMTTRCPIACTEPPVAPVASMRPPLLSTVSAAACSTIRPPSLRTPLASMCPEFANVPKAPSAVACAISSARSAGASSRARTLGVAASTISTARPAANTISPPGEAMSPVLSTSGASK